MSPQFNSMNELTSYLDTLEKRVKLLEGKNDTLERSFTKVEQDSTNVLPRTSLLSRRFFKRAFAVWGHNFMAQLIIGLVIGLILVSFLLIAGLFPPLTAYINSFIFP
jgi:hypothetical protein